MSKCFQRTFWGVQFAAGLKGAYKPQGRRVCAKYVKHKLTVTVALAGRDFMSMLVSHARFI